MVSAQIEWHISEIPNWNLKFLDGNSNAILSHLFSLWIFEALHLTNKDTFLPFKISNSAHQKHWNQSSHLGFFKLRFLLIYTLSFIFKTPAHFTLPFLVHSQKHVRSERGNELTVDEGEWWGVLWRCKVSDSIVEVRGRCTVLKLEKE